jgi:SAM-dependent methyltransferase
MIAMFTDAERSLCPDTAQRALERYLAGAASPEITLMQLLLACGGVDRLRHCLEPLRQRRDFEPLLRLATDNRGGLERIAAIVAAGLTEERSGIEAIREQFDRAVALAPEASVALYSLGAATTLDRATAEITECLRRWGLIHRDCTVLDIGCGIGRIEWALAREIAGIIGIDLSAGMIDEARRRCAELANVTLRRCSGTDLAEFPGLSFDLILAVDSFPYLVAADPAIAARHAADAARLLRPDGVLAIFNYSYSGDVASDRSAVAELADAYGFTVERLGTRDLSLWDGATFLLRKPGAA